jgi:hypothetical protein
VNISNKLDLSWRCVCSRKMGGGERVEPVACRDNRITPNRLCLFAFAFASPCRVARVSSQDGEDYAATHAVGPENSRIPSHSRLLSMSPRSTQLDFLGQAGEACRLRHDDQICVHGKRHLSRVLNCKLSRRRRRRRGNINKTSIKEEAGAAEAKSRSGLREQPSDSRARASKR